MRAVAAKNKFPFGKDGIRVNAVRLADGTVLKDLYILQQRSNAVFDLITEDDEIIQFVSITGLDKDGKLLDPAVDVTGEELKEATFVVKLENEDKTVSGFATKFHCNKACMADGGYFFDDYVMPEATDPEPVEPPHVDPETESDVEDKE